MTGGFLDTMSIRFIAPTDALHARPGTRPIREVRAAPANDNGPEPASDAMLHAALRHFAAHGMAAAHRARKQAEAALSAGDRQGYLWWLEVCRALDRRTAGKLAAVVGGRS